MTTHNIELFVADHSRIQNHLLFRLTRYFHLLRFEGEGQRGGVDTERKVSDSGMQLPVHRERCHILAMNVVTTTIPCPARYIGSKIMHCYLTYHIVY